MAFTKPQLYAIYGTYLKEFAEMAQMAQGNGVYLEVNISPDGDIQFRSREYFTKNKKECVRTLEIRQGKEYVNENCRTTILKELEETNE